MSTSGSICGNIESCGNPSHLEAVILVAFILKPDAFGNSTVNQTTSIVLNRYISSHGTCVYTFCVLIPIDSLIYINDIKTS